MNRGTIARWITLLAGLTGLFAAAYLLVVYVTGGPIACGVEGGCDLVRASKYAYPWGIPQPLFGVAFYLAILGTLFARWFGGSSKWLIASRVLATIGFIESVGLFFIQWKEIGAFCVWCLVSGASATVLFVSTWLDMQDLTPEKSLKELRYAVYTVFGWLVIAVPLFIWFLR